MMSLLRQIENHLRDTRTPPTRFGRKAARDPRLVLDMRNGRNIGARLAANILAYIESAKR